MQNKYGMLVKSLAGCVRELPPMGIKWLLSNSIVVRHPLLNEMFSSCFLDFLAGFKEPSPDKMWLFVIA